MKTSQSSSQLESRMDAQPSCHLNEEQFATCAMGDEPASEIAAHLEACETCRAEIAAFRDSVESFNVESLAWSESQPSRSLRPLVRDRTPQPAWAIASWALAGCVALATTVSMATHRYANQFPGAPPNTAEAEDTPAQIERDNKLLMAVAEATSTKAASPLQEYGLEASAHEGRTAHVQEAND